MGKIDNQSESFTSYESYFAIESTNWRSTEQEIICVDSSGITSPYNRVFGAAMTTSDNSAYIMVGQIPCAIMDIDLQITESTNGPAGFYSGFDHINSDY